MEELLEILKLLSHLQSFRFVGDELVFQWQGGEVIFWIKQDEEGFHVFVDDHKQFQSPNPYEIARHFSLLGF